MKKLSWVIGILLISAGVLTACGGGSDQTAEDTTQATTEESTGGGEETAEVSGCLDPTYEAARVRDLEGPHLRCEILRHPYEACSGSRFARSSSWME